VGEERRAPLRFDGGEAALHLSSAGPFGRPAHLELVPALHLRTCPRDVSWTSLGRAHDASRSRTDCTSHFWFPRPPWSACFHSCTREETRRTRPPVCPAPWPASPPSPHAHSCTFGNQHPGMMQSSTHSPPRWYPSEPGAYARTAAIKDTGNRWPAGPVRSWCIVGPRRNQRGRNLVAGLGRGEAELLHRAVRVARLEEQRRSCAAEPLSRSPLARDGPRWPQIARDGPRLPETAPDCPRRARPPLRTVTRRAPGPRPWGGWGGGGSSLES